MTTGITDAVHPVDLAALRRLLPTRPRLLALGEPTHGEDDLLDVRNEIFRQLVEHEGYRTIALESDCLLGLAVDEYIASGEGDLDEVVARGLSHGFGQSAANRDLVRWMRAYNEGRPAAEQVHFAGFDGPLEITHAASPRPALAALYAYLAAFVDPDRLPCDADTLDRLLGADERWTNPAAMMDPAQSVGRTPEAAQLRLLADALVALLDTETPHLIAASSRADWQRARLYGRTAVGLLRYHHWMADPSPARMAHLLAQRASMMAANLLALVEQGPTLVYAHNAHLQRTKSSMPLWEGLAQWWSAGAIVAAHLGEEYGVLATALGTIRHRGVEAPPADTLEGHLCALPGDRYLVDARRLAAALADAPLTPRVSPWFGYAPLDPTDLASYDGIVFVRDVTPREG